MLPSSTPEKWGSLTEPVQMVPQLCLRQGCNADPLRASSRLRSITLSGNQLNDVLQ